MEERLELVESRLRELIGELSGPKENGNNEKTLPGDWRDFFVVQSNLLLAVLEVMRVSATQQVSAAQYREWNRRLYEDILPEHYADSFCDPAKAVRVFGEETGRLLSAVAAEMRSAIPYAYEQEMEPVLIRMEFLLELYTITETSFVEDGAEPEYAQLKEALYYFVSDYYETECERRVSQLVDEKRSFAKDLIETADLSDPDYLYRFGEYITENERKLAAYMAELPQEKIDLIADTYTEGYRIGFVNTGKDLSKKKTANIRYPLGMERVVKKAIANFEKMGLQCTIYRAADSMFTGRSVSKNGFFGANPNKQYDYDHKEDTALILDGHLVSRRLECLEQGFIAYKEQARVHAGPAVIETFGETPFTPQSKKEACKYSKEQQELMTRFRMENTRITNQYIPGEERSFTIIAFPVPAIGERFAEIFDATIAINTLEYKKYQQIQAVLIDTLNGAEAMHVRGRGANRTDLTVALQIPEDLQTQCSFENCVADVNIPVGEVFTTPKLEGTNGVLHVSRVFLNELEYRDLSLTFTDGLVTDYHCANFAEEEENRRYIEENVLFHHKSLPMGEAAIGTNTTAYVMARKYGIESLLPILIAEKTGPHFAVGDTCYSHEEDNKSYNPDGKEIIARDNSVSILRRSDLKKAYFGCHTDVTIPYDELGLLEARMPDGSCVTLIENGRFVLPGTEELNMAFDAE
ncbi:MAG: aminopeptidase [Lachnospiraceae bacterium]|nr:aminopeptidase [Lachnospiraceae bacterium]